MSKLNGTGKRKLESWIDAFVSHTDNLESAEIWRKWAAISCIASVLEQKVYVTTSSAFYPNLYTFLIGHAGTGKTRAIMAALGFLQEIPEIHMGYTSMTMAMLVDAMNDAKRTIVQLPDPMIEYHSLCIVADELSAFMDQYDTGLIAGLTTFYDVVPYGQGRRTRDIKIKIKRPQLNILSGSTPANLIKFMPEHAWEQGFTSRCMMIYSNDRPIVDVFNTKYREKPKDMLHDLEVINKQSGQLGWTEEWAIAMHNWKLQGHKIEGYDPPNHPKLEHYNARRFGHMMKLSMIACIDRGNDMIINKADFNRSMGWLIEAEAGMGDIFKAGPGTADSQAMEEIMHFVKAAGGKGVGEHLVLKFAQRRLPAHTIRPAIELLVRSYALEVIAEDAKTGLRKFIAS